MPTPPVLGAPSPSEELRSTPAGHGALQTFNSSDSSQSQLSVLSFPPSPLADLLQQLVCAAPCLRPSRLDNLVALAAHGLDALDMLVGFRAHPCPSPCRAQPSMICVCPDGAALEATKKKGNASHSTAECAIFHGGRGRTMTTLEKISEKG